MSPLLIPILDKIIGTVSNYIDPSKRAEAEIAILRMQQEAEFKEIDAALTIAKEQSANIRTEGASEHWLAANWRPILMLVFGGLIVARWFGFTAPGIAEAEYLKLWSIVEIGIGGYVIGRSAEKIVPSIASALKR